MDKLNALEASIVAGEDSAEDARWQQAEEVVRRLDRRETQRAIAASWINGRTRKPYTHGHVGFCAEVWQRFGYCNSQDRPDWTTAYYTVQQGAVELVAPEDRQRKWSDDHEARAPKSEETAERLVANLAKAPAEVQDAVYHGLREQRAGQYLEPQARARRRKEAEAQTDDVLGPVHDSLAPLGAERVIGLIDEATERLREAGQRFSETQRDDVNRAIDALVYENAKVNEVVA